MLARPHTDFLIFQYIIISDGLESRTLTWWWWLWRMIHAALYESMSCRMRRNRGEQQQKQSERGAAAYQSDRSFEYISMFLPAPICSSSLALTGKKKRAIIRRRGMISFPKSDDGVCCRAPATHPVNRRVDLLRPAAAICSPIINFRSQIDWKIL